jgi:hypothetical protein
MNKEEIRKAIEELACSQGFYGRILESVKMYPHLLDEWEKENFKDVVDMVRYFEQEDN